MAQFDCVLFLSEARSDVERWETLALHAKKTFREMFEKKRTTHDMAPKPSLLLISLDFAVDSYIFY